MVLARLGPKHWPTLFLTSGTFGRVDAREVPLGRAALLSLRLRRRWLVDSASKSVKWVPLLGGVGVDTPIDEEVHCPRENQPVQGIVVERVLGLSKIIHGFVKVFKHPHIDGENDIMYFVRGRMALALMER